MRPQPGEKVINNNTFLSELYCKCHYKRVEGTVWYVMMNLYNTSSHSYCFPYYYLETLLISRKQQTMSKMCLRVLSESVLILNSAGPHEKHFRQTDESRPAVNNNTSQKQTEWKVVRTLARVQTNGTSLLILLLPKGMQPGLFKALTLRRHDTFSFLYTNAKMRVLGW